MSARRRNGGDILRIRRSREHGHTQEKEVDYSRNARAPERGLPPNLRDYAKDVRKLLARLERDIERARANTRRQAAALLREASYRLGELEARGEAAWQRLTRRYRDDAIELLRRLERAVAGSPARKGARRKAARKATARKKTAGKKAVRGATGRKKTSRKKATRKASGKKTTTRKKAARKATGKKTTTRKKAARKGSTKKKPARKKGARRR